MQYEITATVIRQLLQKSTARLPPNCAAAFKPAKKLPRNDSARAGFWSIGALGKTSNTQAIKRWLAQIKANALVTDAAQRSGQNLRSMKKSWADRTAKVVEALELLNTQYRSTDGRYMDEDHECWPTTRSGG